MKKLAKNAICNVMVRFLPRNAMICKTHLIKEEPKRPLKIKYAAEEQAIDIIPCQCDADRSVNRTSGLCAKNDQTMNAMWL
jgi:hypothetical protein